MEKSTLISSACTKLMKLIISAKNFNFRKFINAMTRVYMIDAQMCRIRRALLNTIMYVFKQLLIRKRVCLNIIICPVIVFYL